MLQKYITKGMANQKGATRWSWSCLERVEYWGSEENADSIHKLAQQAWPDLVVRTYVVQTVHDPRRGNAERPLIRRWI